MATDQDGARAGPVVRGCHPLILTLVVDSSQQTTVAFTAILKWRCCPVRYAGGALRLQDSPESLGQSVVVVVGVPSHGT